MPSASQRSSRKTPQTLGAFLWLGPALHRADLEITHLRRALAWAVDQIDDDLDPVHQAALANAKTLLEGHK